MYTIIFFWFSVLSRQKTENIQLVLVLETSTFLYKKRVYCSFGFFKKNLRCTFEAVWYLEMIFKYDREEKKKEKVWVLLEVIIGCKREKPKKRKITCVGRESNPGQLLGRQLCSPLYYRRWIEIISTTFFANFWMSEHSTAYTMSARALSLGFLTLFLSCFDTLPRDVIMACNACRTDAVFWKSVLTCLFVMHDEIVAEEIKKCTNHTKRDSLRLANEALSVLVRFLT